MNISILYVSSCLSSDKKTKSILPKNRCSVNCSVFSRFFPCNILSEQNFQKWPSKSIINVQFLTKNYPDVQDPSTSFTNLGSFSQMKKKKTKKRLLVSCGSMCWLWCWWLLNSGPSNFDERTSCGSIDFLVYCLTFVYLSQSLSKLVSLI